MYVVLMAEPPDKKHRSATTATGAAAVAATAATVTAGVMGQWSNPKTNPVTGAPAWSAHARALIHPLVQTLTYEGREYTVLTSGKRLPASFMYIPISQVREEHVFRAVPKSAATAAAAPIYFVQDPDDSFHRFHCTTMLDVTPDVRRVGPGTTIEHISVDTAAQRSEAKRSEHAFASRPHIGFTPGSLKLFTHSTVKPATKGGVGQNTKSRMQQWLGNLLHHVVHRVPDHQLGSEFAWMDGRSDSIAATNPEQILSALRVYATIIGPNQIQLLKAIPLPDRTDPLANEVMKHIFPSIPPVVAAVLAAAATWTTTPPPTTLSVPATAAAAAVAAAAAGDDDLLL